MSVLFVSIRCCVMRLGQVVKDVFFFQVEDGIRDLYVTGVQTCALPISVPATHPGPRRVRMAGRRFRDGAAAGTAGLLPGNGGVLRPGEASRAAIVAQGRTGRRVPDRGARHAVGGAPRVSQSGPGAGAEGGVGAVPLVSAGACGGGVLPSYNGPRRALACRIRRYPRADSSTG